MKKFLILPLLVLLTGCVSYYQPETAFEDGVYYAGDDPSYVLNSSDYSGVIVYPWSSLDYFYMGYGSYYGHYFAYGYPYGYYGHYSPWHFASYYHPYWRPYRGYCAYQYGCRGGHWVGGDERYARHNGDGRRGRDAASELGEDNTSGRQSDDDLNDNSSIRRSVTTAPGGYSGHQGMIVRNNANTKIGNSHHLEPAKSTTANSSSVRVSSPALTSRPSARTATNTSSGNRARSSPSSPSSTRQSFKSSKSARRRDRD